MIKYCDITSQKLRQRTIRYYNASFSVPTSDQQRHNIIRIMSATINLSQVEINSINPKCIYIFSYLMKIRDK